MAELFTKITFKGSKREVLAMLQTLYDVLCEEEKDFYLDGAEIVQDSDSVDLGDYGEEELADLAAEYDNKEIEIFAYGPYGIDSVSETPFFESIANAAPKASFKGEINGFTTGQVERHLVKFEKGILYLEHGIMPDEMAEEDDGSEGDSLDPEKWDVTKETYDPSTKEYKTIE